MMPQVSGGLQITAAEKFRQYLYDHSLGLKHKKQPDFSEAYLFDLLDDVALENQQEYTNLLTQKLISVELLFRYLLDFPARFRKFFALCSPEQYLINTQRICEHLSTLNYVQDEAKFNFNTLKRLINEIGYYLDIRQLTQPVKDQILTVLLSCLLKSKFKDRAQKIYQDYKIIFFLDMLTDVNILDNDGDSLLHIAMRSEDYFDDTVRTLERKGAKITLHNRAEETPLTLALQHHPEYIKQVASKVINLETQELNNILKTAILYANMEWIISLTAKIHKHVGWSKLQTAKAIFPHEQAITSTAVQGFVVFARETKIEMVELLDSFAAENKLNHVFAIIKALLQSKDYWINIEGAAGKQIFYYLAHNQNIALKLLTSDALEKTYFINDFSLNPLARFFIKKDKTCCPLTAAIASSNVHFIHFIIIYAQYLDSSKNPLVLELQNAILTLRKNNININSIVDYLNVQAAKHWAPSKWFTIQYRLLQVASLPYENTHSNPILNTSWDGFFWSFCTKSQDQFEPLDIQLRQPLLAGEQSVVTTTNNAHTQPRRLIE